MESINFHFFSRQDVPSEEFDRVKKIADMLRLFIERKDVKVKIAAANLHGKPSHDIQACIIEGATNLGFESEKKGLFSSYKTANLRPDYFLRLSEGRGIILEVERGKTLANNMDLLDMWKCHICEEAQYLFLMVPMIRPDQNGKITKIFPKVIERIGPFFIRKNYLDVCGVFVFGY